MKIKKIINTGIDLIFICEDNTMYKHTITPQTNTGAVFGENCHRFSINNGCLNFFNENCYPFIFREYYYPIEEIQNKVSYLRYII